MVIHLVSVSFALTLKKQSIGIYMLCFHWMIFRLWILFYLLQFVQMCQLDEPILTEWLPVLIFDNIIHT